MIQAFEPLRLGESSTQARCRWRCRPRL